MLDYYGRKVNVIERQGKFYTNSTIGIIQAGSEKSLIHKLWLLSAKPL